MRQIASMALNASYLALLDAGIPMSTSFASVSCLINNEGQFLLDPHQFEMEDNHFLSCHTFCFGSKNELLLTESFGEFSIEEVIIYY